ncbi:MAG: hypothetical protein KF797_07825 [Flavobacteriales bacterium]|nr:hypothetical protein [Flavobacteriales bacterium]
MTRITSLLVLLAAMAVPAVTTAQTLVYRWLNVPCAQNLNCDEGCSACNMPANSNNALFGSGASWFGVDVCPHPVSEADNAVYTTGWSYEADPYIFIGFNAISTDDVQIDSIIVSHRRSADGPRLLRATFSPDPMNVPVLLGETEVTQQFEETIYTDLGCLRRSPNSPYPGMQFRLQGIHGEGGDLQIDEVRIVSSPCATIRTGITEDLLRSAAAPNGLLVDVLGRAVPERPVPGVYIGARKRVQVVP